MSFVIIAVILGGVLMFLFASPSTSRYPDGKCYLCRQGSALPGDTCKKCGTEQP